MKNPIVPISLLSLWAAATGLHAATPAAGFGAYHTRTNPSPVGHIGKYEDLIVTLGKSGRFEFIRAHPFITVAGQTVKASGTVLPLYEWSQVSATVGSGMIRLHVNGREVASGAFKGPLTAPDTALILGRNNELEGNTDPVRRPKHNLQILCGIQGLLDEVRIHGQALRPEQMLQAPARVVIHWRSPCVDVMNLLAMYVANLKGETLSHCPPAIQRRQTDPSPRPARIT